MRKFLTTNGHSTGFSTLCVPYGIYPAHGRKLTRENKNRWGSVLLAVGVLVVQGWAADSALTTRVEPRDKGLTTTVTVGLSQ